MVILLTKACMRGYGINETATAAYVFASFSSV